MKLLIVGSRSIKNIDIAPYVPEGVDTIISGGADGIDSLAEQYADTHRLSKYIIRPRYDRWKRFAPLKRNTEMVDMADIVLIIWDGRSKGTHPFRHPCSPSLRLFVFLPYPPISLHRCLSRQRYFFAIIQLFLSFFEISCNSPLTRTKNCGIILEISAHYVLIFTA